MPEIVSLTKEFLRSNIENILIDTADFEYNNWGREHYNLELPDKWKLSIALLNNGTINGFSVNSRKSDIFYIHFFYIFKKYRNSKAGKILLNECENKALENNLLKIQLKCDSKNSAALKFYLKYGFSYSNSNLPGAIKFLLEKKLNK